MWRNRQIAGNPLELLNTTLGWKHTYGTSHSGVGIVKTLEDWAISSQVLSLSLELVEENKDMDAVQRLDGDWGSNLLVLLRYSLLLCESKGITNWNKGSRLSSTLDGIFVSIYIIYFLYLQKYKN